MRTIRLLLAALLLALPLASNAQIGISVRIGPPAIPVYEQPICPGDGYLWTPGYWAWDDGVSDYYWVPGLWVEAPEVGFLWTPGWWGWREGGFFFNDGFWGPTVGFYGGIDYGFGYFGTGFGGGRWDNGHFFYNRAVLNVDVTNIHNVYNTTVEHNTTTRVSYNGGQGGITARPTAAEQAAASERHVPAVAAQTQHIQTARSDPQSRASVNHGTPPTKAVAGRAEEGAGARAAESARDAGAAEPRQPTHASELTPITKPAPVNSGDAKADSKYQKQQDKLIEKQSKEQQKLQQQQEAEHQKKLNDVQHQQMEQKHQQQTQQMQQRHSSEMQQLQQRAPAPRPAGRPR